MNQILTNWDALENRKKLIFMVATAVAMLAMVSVARLATQPSMSLLYSGLDSAAAGEVIASLDQQNIIFEVRGSAIYVESGSRDQTRLSLAGQGLPAAGSVGYELLDSMTGFGTTSQMFDAAYWRAKEGELARTILASNDIRAARVHVATPINQPFARNIEASASVTVTMARGQLDKAQAEAIRYLVASAVAGLSALDVAVIDAEVGIILATGSEVQSNGAASGPNAQAATLKANVERLLAARVGPGKAVVEVSIDADMDSQTIIERVVDPTSRVAISSDSEERSESSTGNDSGAVTVASNLPDGDAGGGASTSTSTTSESKERLNFEVSETRRERIVQPGQIRRISIAVIVDGISEFAEDGTRTWTPRPEDEMTILRGLVESAVGYDPARGDTVTMETLEFPEDTQTGTLVTDDGAGFFTPDIVKLVQTVILSIVALVIGLFVIRPILTQQPPLPTPDLNQSNDINVINGQLSLPGDGDAGAELPSPDQTKLENLREVIKERSDESADVLRRWIDTPGTTSEGA